METENWYLQNKPRIMRQVRFAPYVRWIDFCWFAAMRVRLDRTENHRQGGQRCDYRVSRREPVEVEPEFLHV